MLIYLLKATLAWGFSLLLFEGLLRRNSYHAANRLYLLGTLLAGFLLPLLELDWAAPTAFSPAREFFQTTGTVTETIAAATQDGSASFFPLTAQTLLLFLYALGFGMAASRIVRDSVALARIRRGSKPERLPDGCTLYETGGEHGPFSFFNAIFLSSREAYTGGELAMVISHERQHARLFHSADMLLVQALKVVLWFHPLIHLYARRLRLVHEYEADETAAQEPIVYGRFLVEQALTSPALSLTHAFHSPIKTRIAMLTNNKRGTGRALRYALTLPLIAALVAAFSIPGYTDERKIVGNKLFYRGNEFTMTEKKVDTMIVQDARTGEDMVVVTNLDPRPLSMNGEIIYQSEDIVRGAEYAGKEESALAEYLKRISSTLGELQDGAYVITIYDIVIDKKGRMAYDAGAHIWACPTCKAMTGEPVLPEHVSTSQATELPKDVEQRIDAVISRELARGFSFRPAEKSGVPVNAFLRGDLDPDQGHLVIVQSGKARLQPKGRFPGSRFR